MEVDAVGVAVMRVRHGQDDGEGRGADDFGFGDDDLNGIVSLMLSCIYDTVSRRLTVSTSGA